MDFNEMNRQVVAEFRANGGKAGGMFEGAPLAILTSIGAKSGAERVSPLVYVTDEDKYVIIASKGGMPTNPDWYHNLKANPTATLEVGTETFTVTAEEVTGAERDRLYAKMVAIMPNFAEYERISPRKIPVFVLTRAA